MSKEHFSQDILFMEKNTDVIDSIGTGSVMVDADSSFETAPDRHPSTEEASARIESVNQTQRLIQDVKKDLLLVDSLVMTWTFLSWMRIMK